MVMRSRPTTHWCYLQIFLQEPVFKRGPGCREPDIGEAVYPFMEYRSIPFRRLLF